MPAAGYAYEVIKNLSVSATFKYLYSDMGKIGNSNGASSVAFDLGILYKLEGIETAERARMFTNVEVYFPVKHAEEAEDGELSWNFFVGFRMEDVRHGELGEVVEVDTATVNTLFVVEQEDGEELLIPAQEEFIVEINQEKKLITVELPEGLLNLEDLEED